MAAAVAVAGGCRARAEHERLGDRRYAERAWADAMAEYRLATRQRRPGTELRTKLGQAALRAGALREAAAAYRDRAREDAAAGPEGVEGLVRVGRQAAPTRDVRALQIVVEALRDIAPARLGEIGAALADGLDPEGRGEADADLLIVAAAHAAPGAAESLLVGWADLAVRVGRCDAAARGYDAVLRREATGLLRAARSGLAGCRVEEGRALLARGRLEDAEEAFRAAIALAMPDSTVRLAWVLIGDARWAGGDSLAAEAAYAKAIEGGDPAHPIVRRAESQLRRLLQGNPLRP